MGHILRMFVFSFLGCACLADASKTRVLGAAAPTLEQFDNYRLSHRRTNDGRLCAASHVQSEVAHTACATHLSPEGVAGREWCYVEEQAAAAGPNTWGYCAPNVDYAAVRTRMRYAFEEKAHELAETTRVLLGLTKESAQIIDQTAIACGTPTVAQTS